MRPGSLKPSRSFVAFAAAILVLAFTGAAVPVYAQTYSVIYTSPGSPGIQNPLGLIAQGRDGNMYSVSSNGGTFYGTAFKFSPSGAVTVINDVGYFPYGGLTLGSDGNFYGQDSDGGVVGNCGLSGGGQVYKLTPAGTLTVLHNFTGGTDGCDPMAAPIEGTNGIYYGTTPNTNNGTIYSVTSAGVFTTLHTFDVTDGQGAYAPLVQGTDGNFYGNTVYGGSSGDGVIFKMTPAGVLTVLHNFTGIPDGRIAVLRADPGDRRKLLWRRGRRRHVLRHSFQDHPAGVFTVLHTFQDGPSDGAGPSSSLTQGSDGKLYGVTSAGGTTGGGTIYSITTTGTYTFSTTSSIPAPPATTPTAPLRQNTNGKFYGDAYYGGDSNCNCGVLYSFDMKLGAFINLQSSAGKEGAKIGILGQGFSASSVVKFAGVQATSVVRTGTTFITATVPAGALTGKVTVTTGTKTLTSAQTFKVTPSITCFDPPSGPVGTSVNIVGTGLTQTTKVTFNGKSASFTDVSDTDLTATVPTGAKTGKIAVTTTGGTATSTKSFTVN